MFILVYGQSMFAEGISESECFPTWNLDSLQVFRDAFNKNKTRMGWCPRTGGGQEYKI